MYKNNKVGKHSNKIVLKPCLPSTMGAPETRSSVLSTALVTLLYITKYYKAICLQWRANILEIPVPVLIELSQGKNLNIITLQRQQDHKPLSHEFQLNSRVVIILSNYPFAGGWLGSPLLLRYNKFLKVVLYYQTFSQQGVSSEPSCRQQCSS